MESPPHSMRPHPGLVTFFCLVVFLISCTPTVEQPEPAAEATTEADVAAIKQVIDEYETATNAGDVEGRVAAYTEDAVRIVRNAPEVIGKEAIREHYQRQSDRNTYEVTITLLEVVVAGDWAFSRYTAAFKITPKAGGEPREGSRKGITILQRQPDGSWKVAREIGHFSDNPPPGTGE